MQKLKLEWMIWSDSASYVDSSLVRMDAVDIDTDCIKLSSSKVDATPNSKSFSSRPIPEGITVSSGGLTIDYGSGDRKIAMLNK